MGSLMAGWDSPVPDPKAMTYQRNRSFTKGEIEAYWRSKKRREEEHLRAISGSSNNSQESTYGESGGRVQRSSSLPVVSREENFTSFDSNKGLEKLVKRNDWWTRSNWAFLNEPPVLAAEVPSYKYASQHHVTSFGS